MNPFTSGSGASAPKTVMNPKTVMKPAALKHHESGIPLVQLVPFLLDATKSCKTIVSVGCGTGKYELFLMKQKELFGLEWVLVDPAQQSFDTGPVILKADYATVGGLMRERPHLFGNCVVLLIWSNPSQSVYDYEAVQSLHPTDIVVLWETAYEHKSGLAMGEKLFQKLQQKGEYQLLGQKLYRSDGFDGTGFALSQELMMKMVGTVPPPQFKELLNMAYLWPRLSWYRRSSLPVSNDRQTKLDTLVHPVVAPNHDAKFH